MAWASPKGATKSRILSRGSKRRALLQRVVEDFPERRDGLDFREAAELLASFQSVAEGPLCGEAAPSIRLQYPGVDTDQSAKIAGFSVKPDERTIDNSISRPGGRCLQNILQIR
jgi:hypothetical protein